MKKLIAVLLTFIFVLSMAACGQKKPAETTAPVGDSGNTQQQVETTQPASESTPTTPNAVTPDATDPTVESTPDDPNKVDTPVTTPNQGNGDQGDTDIKVEINNGTSDDPVVSTPPTDDDPENSFVIDFDQLLDASDRN